MLKNPCIPLVPDRPRDNHGDGGLGLTIWHSFDASACPPVFNRFKQRPRGSVEPEHGEFFNDQRPKAPGVAALVEEVRSAFLHRPAKRAEIAIWPPTLCQSIRRPNSVLKGQPSKKIDFGGCPNLPNHFVQGRKDHP